MFKWTVKFVRLIGAIAFQGGSLQVLNCRTEGSGAGANGTHTIKVNQFRGDFEVSKFTNDQATICNSTHFLLPTQWARLNSLHSKPSVIELSSAQDSQLGNLK